jgi:hypothetical protein
VNRVQGVVRLLLCFEEARARGVERGANRIRPRGQLRTRCVHPDPDLAAGFVHAMKVAPDDGQRESHGGSLFT